MQNLPNPAAAVNAPIALVLGGIAPFHMSKTKQQARVGFLSFFKLDLLYGLALGQLAGAGFLVAGICGLPVHLNLGAWHIEGLPAGPGGLILLPPAFAIVSLVIAPVVFLPFTLACRVFGGFKVS